MENYIRSASFNIQDGKLQGTMEFDPGLNIISGENGTFKTKLLQYLKTIGPNELSLHVPGHPIRRQGINPKRNSERKTFDAIAQVLNREDKKLAALINEQNINDASFQPYPSMGELFYVVYKDLCGDGGDQIEKMNQTADEFNSVVKHIFSKYQLIAEWREGVGPQLEVFRKPNHRFPLEGLSLGELDVLSLATNLYSSREAYDIFFIDEPEVHLNWELELKLFEFLDYLATEHNVQLIVVTHSRVAFTERFFPKTKFLTWNEADGRVKWSNDVTEEQRQRIAGDAIELIKLGQFRRPTFFVEDKGHELVIQEIADVLNVEVSVSQCTTKNNVRSMYRLSLEEGDWTNSYFLVDGDNEGDPYAEDNKFIHLDKYCIETYLIDVALASQISGRSEIEVRQHLLDSIRERRHAIFRSGKNKFFEFLIDRLTEVDLTEDSLATLDASEVIDSFAQKLGMDKKAYVAKFVRQVHDDGRLADVFPRQFIEAIAPPEPEPGEGAEGPKLKAVD